VTADPPRRSNGLIDAPVVVVGSYNLDTVVDVDLFPAPGETIIARAARKSHGGKGSNQAVQAARCGATVSFIACVGADAAGRAAIEFWRAEQIQCDGVLQHPMLPTGEAAILVDRAGENMIVVTAAANMAVTPEYVVARLSAGDRAARVLVTQLETPLDAARAAFHWGRLANVTTVLNAAPAGAPLDATLLELADIVVVNEVEALALVGGDGVGSDSAAAALAVASRVNCSVVLTRGREGASLFRRNKPPFHVRAPDGQAVDTTGAGDAFIGAFAADLASSADIESAVRWGVSAGSFACRGHGAAPSYGTADEIRASSHQLLL